MTGQACAASKARRRKTLIPTGSEDVGTPVRERLQDRAHCRERRQRRIGADRSCCGTAPGLRRVGRPKTKRPEGSARGVFAWKGCLTMSYFHERMLTIIGAESFHGPVRDGKGWYRLAMVTRL